MQEPESTEPTEFQIIARDRVIALLKNVDLRPDFEIVRIAADEVYLLARVNTDDHKFAIYIYEASAGFDVDERWIIFEEQDFWKKPSQLIDAFCSALKEWL